MNKIVCLIIFSAIISINGFTQQEIQSTQYMLNPFLLNPAYSSVDDNTDVKFGYRYQWKGIEGAPETYYASIHKPIGKARWGRTHPGDFHNWHGAGAYMIQDNLGAYRNTKVNVNYSYNIGITQGDHYGYDHSDGVRLALGMFLGWNTFSVDKQILSQSKTSGLTTFDNSNTIQDLVYQNMEEASSNSVLDFSFGGMLYYGEKYFVGLSSTQILESDIYLTEKAEFSRHYFATFLAKLEFAQDFFVIPSTIVKIVNGAPVSVNFNARVDWKDQLFAGFGYRTEDAYTFMVGAQLFWGEHVKKFRISKSRYTIYAFYSYDYTISHLGDQELTENSKGAHEITLGFLLPPRYEERNAEDTWKGFKKGKRGKNRKHFLKQVF